MTAAGTGDASNEVLDSYRHADHHLSDISPLEFHWGYPPLPFPYGHARETHRRPGGIWLTQQVAPKNG